MQEWDTGDKSKCTLSTECPHKKKVQIYISRETYNKIKTLCRKYEDNEWMAGLKGEEDKDGNISITDIKLYEQEVSGATVELTDQGAEDMSKDNNIGWIHSHNKMDVFLSSTDIGTASWNRLSVVVNNDMKFDGGIKIKLPCGSDMLMEIEVFTDEEENTLIKELSESLIKIKKRIVKYTNNPKEEEYGDFDFCVVCGKRVSEKKAVYDDDYNCFHINCFPEGKQEALKRRQELNEEKDYSDSYPEILTDAYEERYNRFCY